jgi:hypothetical protein
MKRPQGEWAREAAAKLLNEFADAAAIDTANYQLCGFILAAAKAALEDAAVAHKVESLMEPQRISTEAASVG